MNYEPKPGCWHVVGWNDGDQKPQETKCASSKINAAFWYDCMKSKYDQIAVFDPEADYCDPSEL